MAESPVRPFDRAVRRGRPTANPAPSGTPMPQHAGACTVGMRLAPGRSCDVYVGSERFHVLPNGDSTWAYYGIMSGRMEPCATGSAIAAMSVGGATCREPLLTSFGATISGRPAIRVSRPGPADGPFIACMTSETDWVIEALPDVDASPTLAGVCVGGDVGEWTSRPRR